ncbi:MAG: hypothetical protein M1321_01215 [Candidatus Marsarchaeota archaeon]|nr:hypothetical protein [Candidatus Marsarchaeota archaeon]
MRSQSSVEFLSTYGFVFLVIGVVISLVFVISTYNGGVASTQCTSFSGLTCNYASYYYNVTYGHGMVYLSISNSQNSPINITGVNITVDGTTANGICAPDFLYQGQESTCTAMFSATSAQSSLHNGGFDIRAGFCTSAGNRISSADCTYIPASYTGGFQVYSSANDSMPFSTIVAYVPGTVQLPAEPTAPQIPSNYLIVQNWDIVPSRNLTGFKYLYGTASYTSSKYFNANVLAYPSMLSILNSNSVPCSAPYRSTVSVSSSVFYMPASGTVSFEAESDNAIEIYYKQGSWPGWVKAFTAGTEWTLNAAPVFLSQTNTLSQGLYQITVESVNTCGDGLQAVSVNGIGQ